MEEPVQGQNPVQPAKRPRRSVPEDRGQDQKRGLSAFRSYGYDFKLPGQVNRDPSMMNLSWKEFLAEPPKQRKQEKLDLDAISAMWKEAAAACASKSTDHLDTPSGEHPDIPPFGPHPKLSEEEAAWKEFLESKKGEYGECLICLKSGDHAAPSCPYNDYIPKGARVGPGIEIICRGCGAKDHGHPDGTWTGRAIIKSCCICGMALDHWSDDCPLADPLSDVNTSKATNVPCVQSSGSETGATTPFACVKFVNREDA